MHVTALFLGELGIVSLFYMFSNNWFQDAHFLSLVDLPFYWQLLQELLFLWHLLPDTHFLVATAA